MKKSPDWEQEVTLPSKKSHNKEKLLYTLACVPLSSSDLLNTGQLRGKCEITITLQCSSGSLPV